MAASIASKSFTVLKLSRASQYHLDRLVSGSEYKQPVSQAFFFWENQTLSLKRHICNFHLNFFTKRSMPWWTLIIIGQSSQPQRSANHLVSAKANCSPNLHMLWTPTTRTQASHLEVLYSWSSAHNRGFRALTKEGQPRRKNLPPAGYSLHQ